MNQKQIKLLTDLRELMHSLSNECEEDFRFADIVAKTKIFGRCIVESQLDLALVIEEESADFKTRLLKRLTATISGGSGFDIVTNRDASYELAFGVRLATILDTDVVVAGGYGGEVIACNIGMSDDETIAEDIIHFLQQFYAVSEDARECEIEEI